MEVCSIQYPFDNLQNISLISVVVALIIIAIMISIIHEKRPIISPVSVNLGRLPALTVPTHSFCGPLYLGVAHPSLELTSEAIKLFVICTKYTSGHITFAIGHEVILTTSALGDRGVDHLERRWRPRGGREGLKVARIWKSSVTVASMACRYNTPNTVTLMVTSIAPRHFWHGPAGPTTKSLWLQLLWHQIYTRPSAITTLA